MSPVAALQAIVDVASKALSASVNNPGLAVQALNQEYAVVGWSEVTIGAVPEDRLGDGGTSSHRAAVRTTNLATTAVVDSCWLED